MRWAISKDRNSGIVLEPELGTDDGVGIGAQYTERDEFTPAYLLYWVQGVSNGNDMPKMSQTIKRLSDSKMCSMRSTHSTS
jgi:hypothetical protein